MEHSLLHGAQLVGLLVTLAAPILVLALVRPALGGAPTERDATTLARALSANAARWAWRAALVAAAATLADLAVQVAEVENVTILAGVDPSLVAHFALATTVGRLALARGVLSIACAGVAWSIARSPQGGTAPAAPRSQALELRRQSPIGPVAHWAVLAFLASSATIAASLVSHSAAQPAFRGGAIALETLHLAAAATWIGTLVHLALDRALLARATTPGALGLVARIVARFSPIALSAASLLALSGATGAWFYIRSPAFLLTSAYGLTLTVKLLLLGALLAGGFVNYRRVRPDLARIAASGLALGGGDRNRTRTEATAAATLARLSRTIELEVTAGLLIIAVAGILGSVSPPGDDGSGRLTAAQIAAVTRPRLPVTGIVDPATWVGSASRTDDDLRYSEFMHSWSGVAVCFLGIAWLVQSAAGGAGRVVGRLWPLGLIPFAIFVGVASDPEVWPLGAVSPWAALRDPVVLEHRIGALMIVALAWLGLREERRGVIDRPLGRSLPVLMIFGSLLLLGHAHSSFSGSEHLASLINAQHAVLGGLGLLAGAVRWVQIRRLFPERLAALLWPALVIAIGLFMALSYRELA